MHTIGLGGEKSVFMKKTVKVSSKEGPRGGFCEGREKNKL